jgi:hypothetical protein
MNGFIDAVGRFWTDSNGVTSLIALTEQGRFLCPLCARDHREQPMSKLPLSNRFYCPEGHQLSWGRDDREDRGRLA